MASPTGENDMSLDKPWTDAKLLAPKHEHHSESMGASKESDDESLKCNDGLGKKSNKSLKRSNNSASMGKKPNKLPPKHEHHSEECGMASMGAGNEPDKLLPKHKDCDMASMGAGKEPDDKSLKCNDDSGKEPNKSLKCNDDLASMLRGEEPNKLPLKDDSANDEQHHAQNFNEPIHHDNAPEQQQLAIRNQFPYFQFTYENDVFHAKAHISYFRALCFGVVLGIFVTLLMVGIVLKYTNEASFTITSSCYTSNLTEEKESLQSKLDDCRWNLSFKEDAQSKLDDCIQNLTSTIDVLREDAATSQTELSTCNGLLSSAINKINDLKNSKEDASQWYAELDVCNGKLSSTRNSLKDMQQTVSSVKQDYSNCQKAVKSEQKDHEDTKLDLEYVKAHYYHSWSSTNVVLSFICGLGILLFCCHCKPRFK